MYLKVKIYCLLLPSFQICILLEFLLLTVLSSTIFLICHRLKKWGIFHSKRCQCAILSTMTSTYMCILVNTCLRKEVYAMVICYLIDASWSEVVCFCAWLIRFLAIVIDGHSKYDGVDFYIRIFIFVWAWHGSQSFLDVNTVAFKIMVRIIILM